MKIYTDYNKAEKEVGTIGEALDYIKENCVKDILNFGSNSVIYWVELNKMDAIEITYHYPTDTLNLVFTGAYGELCGSHRFIHQMNFN